MADTGRSFVNEKWPEYDVCVIAGDLCSSNQLIQSINLCCSVFKEIIYVAGNHEYYHSSILSVKKKINKIKFPNFHFLDNSSVTIQGQRFIGGTMWFEREKKPWLREQLNDFKLISDIDAAYEENRKFQFLSEHIESDDVVVTHHSPSNQSIPDEYKGSEINCFFVYDCTDVILEKQPKLWLHGHTHSSFDYKIRDTRIAANPLGYPGENQSWVPHIFEV